MAAKMGGFTKGKAAKAGKNPLPVAGKKKGKGAASAPVAPGAPGKKGPVDPKVLASMTSSLKGVAK